MLISTVYLNVRLITPEAKQIALRQKEQETIPHPSNLGKTFPWSPEGSMNHR